MYFITLISQQEVSKTAKDSAQGAGAQIKEKLVIQETEGETVREMELPVAPAAFQKRWLMR